MCSAQVIPINGFIHLQDQVRSILDQEIQQGADLPNLDPQTRSSGGPRIWFACPHPRQKLKHSPTCYGECFLVPYDQKGWPQLLESVSQWCLSQETSRQSRLSPEQIQYWAWSIPMLCTGRGINS